MPRSPAPENLVIIGNQVPVIDCNHRFHVADVSNLLSVDPDSIIAALRNRGLEPVSPQIAERHGFRPQRHFREERLDRYLPKPRPRR
jgi:hypothetical protein